MKSPVMNNANTTPLLPQTLVDEVEPELEPDNDKKAIESNSITQPNQREHPWLIIFLVNIFVANAASSVILLSLAPYLTQIGIPESYLPWVIFTHNAGGAIGSATMGLFYDCTTRICQVEGRGAKICLLVCPLFGIVGSALYASAGWIGDIDMARWLILAGRLFQGIWRGGQTSVEQAYLAMAVEPSVKTEYTATLGTFAVLGGVIGPSIGALFSQIDITIHGLTLNSNNIPGFLILMATLIMFVQTLLFFDGKDTQPGMTNVHIDEEVSTLGMEEGNFDSLVEQLPFNATENMCVKNDKDISNQGDIPNTEESSFNSNENELPFNVKGVLMSIYIYNVFHYCFSVQETITTPMVIKLYGWSATQINSLFAGAGAISLVTSLSVRYGSRRVRDQTLLIAGISIGLLGSILQMDIPQIEKVLPVGRFIVGFILTHMAFCMGRIVVMGIFSNILGPSSQGKWMGVIIATSSMTRAFVPFVAWYAVEVIHWRTWLEFGLLSLFLLMALVGSIMTLRFLVPYSEFIEAHTLLDDKNVDEFHSVTSYTAPPTRTSSLTTSLLDNSSE